MICSEMDGILFFGFRSSGMKDNGDGYGIFEWKQYRYPFPLTLNPIVPLNRI